MPYYEDSYQNGTYNETNSNETNYNETNYEPFDPWFDAPTNDTNVTFASTEFATNFLQQEYPSEHQRPPVGPPPNFPGSHHMKKHHRTEHSLATSSFGEEGPRGGFMTFEAIRSHHGHRDCWENFNIENWDFSKVSRSDAKLLVRSFISYFAMAVFAYCLIAFAIVGAIFLCLLKKARVAVEVHEVAQGPYKHHHHHHVEQASVVADVNGTYRQANGLGYERANISEPNEDARQP